MSNNLLKVQRELTEEDELFSNHEKT
jgi:hypothetical protein